MSTERLAEHSVRFDPVRVAPAVAEPTPGHGRTNKESDVTNLSVDPIHDDEAGILCQCEYCIIQGRCEDAPCCGCCEGGLL